MRVHVQRLLRFALVSGVGLGLDFVLFIALLWLSVAPFPANMISAACAVSFVYFASVRKIFQYQGGFMLGLFLLYLVYQVVAVTAASWGVSFLADRFVSPVAAKVIILPLTFGANYLFMTLLTRKGRALAA
jgi:putative flippase GtrA